MTDKEKKIHVVDISTHVSIGHAELNMILNDDLGDMYFFLF